MHLGQTASYLSKVFNRPEPTVLMVSRIMREGGWIKKGGRGRSAPHISSEELAHFIIAMMSCPDSPAIAVERLPHFAGLPLYDGPQRRTFSEGLSRILEILAKSSWEQAQAKRFAVSVVIDASIATIHETVRNDEGGVEEIAWNFTSLLDAKDDQPMVDSIPLHGGLGVNTLLRLPTLYRIAKVVLAGEEDPLPEILDSMASED